MNVLMVTSETVPFSKSGGLADVVGALSASLSDLGNNVKVFMPMYSFIEKKGFKKSVEISIKMLGEEVKASCVEKKEDNVTYVGLSHPYFTERKGIYGDTSFTPYPDNCARFLFFAKALCEYIKASDFNPDIVHCHDWTAGTVPFYLEKYGIKTKTVFTIHNLAYQGDYSAYDAILAGDTFSDLLFNSNSIDRRINMLKCGIGSATKVTTVSPTYAKEIETEEFGCGLDSLLRERDSDLVGIINGIDYKEWSPSTDIFFKEHYSAKSLKGKKALKERVQKEFGLDVDDNVPLFAMISRLAEQKGFSELLLTGSPCVLERILHDNKVEFIIVGTGDERYITKLKELESKYENLKVMIAFSNEVAHTIEGAADFFLMPSRYEPCGLNQIYSLHYGTLPVAHKTGGLADSIVDLEENPENGTGFLFSTMHEDEIVKAVKRAIDFFSDKDRMKKAIDRAMKEDFTWTRSAEEYEKLYKQIAWKRFGGKKHEE